MPCCCRRVRMGTRPRRGVPLITSTLWFGSADFITNSLCLCRMVTIIISFLVHHTRAADDVLVLSRFDIIIISIIICLYVWRESLSCGGSRSPTAQTRGCEKSEELRRKKTRVIPRTPRQHTSQHGEGVPAALLYPTTFLLLFTTTRLDVMLMMLGLRVVAVLVPLSSMKKSQNYYFCAHRRDDSLHPRAMISYYCCRHEVLWQRMHLERIPLSTLTQTLGEIRRSPATSTCDHFFLP
jgi:hypothetical protein